MVFSVRALSPHDTPAVVDLYARSAAADPTMFELSAEAWDRFVRQDVNMGGAGFLVAEREDRLIGVATSSRRAPGSEVVRHFRIIVEPAARRQGVGRALLRGVLALDADPVLLQSLVPRAWASGRAFLELFAFEVVETEVEMRCEVAKIRPEAGRPGVEVGPERDVRGHASAIAELHNQAYRDDVSFVPFTGAAMGELLADAELWLARDHGRIVAYAHLEDTGTATWIESIVVAPEARGQGLGTLLGASVLEDILVRREKKALLSVSDRNATAHRRYVRLGFVEVDASARLRAPSAVVQARISALEAGR